MSSRRKIPNHLTIKSGCNKTKNGDKFRTTTGLYLKLGKEAAPRGKKCPNNRGRYEKIEEKMEEECPKCTPGCGKLKGHRGRHLGSSRRGRNMSAPEGYVIYITEYENETPATIAKKLKVDLDVIMAANTKEEVWGSEFKENSRFSAGTTVLVPEREFEEWLRRDNEEV